MENIVSYLTAFGLATGAGTKATVPVIALGLFHHTPYFDLSPGWSWIASPPVLAVLIVMLLVELYVDAHPELGSWADAAGYLPAIVSGFIAFAASTGKVDANLAQLATSGLLGGGTAAVTRFVRNLVRRPFRDHVETAHHSIGTAATAGETAFAGVVSAAAFLAPLAAALLAAVAIVAAVGVGTMARPSKRACPHCGAALDPRALVCASCRGDVAG